jgi:hypothetical protein
MKKISIDFAQNWEIFMKNPVRIMADTNKF